MIRHFIGTGGSSSQSPDILTAHASEMSREFSLQRLFGVLTGHLQGDLPWVLESTSAWTFTQTGGGGATVTSTSSGVSA